jgi:hypothetical protein
MAFTLGIDPSRIKIVSVVAGSVVVDFAVLSTREVSNATSADSDMEEVEQAETTETAATKSVAMQEELKTLENLMQSQFSAGSLDLGFPVASMDTVLSVDPLPVVVGITTATVGPTSATTVQFAIRLSNNVTAFDASLVQVVNGTLESLTGANQDWVLTCGVDGAGTLSVIVAEEALTDSLGNTNEEANVEIAYDTVAPLTVLSTRMELVQFPSSIAVAVSFGEPMVGLSLGSIGINGAGATLSQLIEDDYETGQYTVYVQVSLAG